MSASSSNEPPHSESVSPQIENEPPPASPQAPNESVTTPINQPLETFKATPQSVVLSIPTPSVLTTDILSITDKAISNYYSVRAEHGQALSKSEEDPPPSLFSSSSAEELIHYFSAAIDVEHAIRLRESALLADIGDGIKLLSEKLKLYDQDEALRKRIGYEKELIRQESSDRNLKINFHGLGYFRSRNRRLGQSFMEEHNLVFHQIEPTLNAKEASTYLAKHFLKDPTALREHRLFKD